jgi:hypothetical protein
LTNHSLIPPIFDVIFANYLTDSVINIFTTLDSKSHSHRKRMVSNIYSKSYVLSSPTVHASSTVVIYNRLLPLIQQYAISKIPLEILGLNYSYSMDAFTAYQFGLGLGTNFIQDIKTREWYLENYFAIRPYMFWIGDGYKIWSSLMRIGINIIPTKILEAFPEIQAYNLELCDKAEELLSEEATLSIEDTPVIYSQERSAMRKDINAKRFQNPHFLKTKQDYPRRMEIASDMFDMNAAALETSGITLTYLYYELSRHPEVQTKLREELLTLSPSFTFPVPEGQEPELPDSKAVDRLPLLDAILQETLRLYQAVPGRQPRITPAKGCTLAGYTDIPGGVVVQSYGSVLHQNPAVFPGPANWKPDRWLDAGEEELKEMKRWFWAFGSGGRMCVGTHVAIHSKLNSLVIGFVLTRDIDMKSAIAAIYTNYATTVVSTGDMAQCEGFMGEPVGKNVVLQFRHV